MPECIERDAAIDAITEVYYDTPSINMSSEKFEAAVRKIPAADVVPGELFRELRDELCLYCGRYTEQHLGACDGCKWRGDNE